MTELRQRAIAIYDAFTHEHRDRRTLLRQMVALAGSVAAAEALIAGIAATPAAAAIAPADDARLRTGRKTYGFAGSRRVVGYTAEPVGGVARRRGAVIVIHENRGLTAHIEDVARRVALAGFLAVAPDLLTDQGGTPADEDKARDMIGTADLGAVTGDTVALVKALSRMGNGKVGIIGFCWGGAMVNRVAIAAGPALAAGVSYYGPAPDPAEAVKVAAPLLLHYAGLDTRVAATGEPWIAALKAAGKDVTAYTYPGVNHAFNNDTSADRYDARAAALAWGRTIAFLHDHLDSPG
ncbi:dienelactone hydrolase family protein [Hephaestia sp. GCM10023244]|uniref:dienelactone hydrolase family protein n=1 Tax=unclassified Hephaestia TaxID=2631281 RepID=UPI0020773E50|nr:dienelactone hydrolase family protein [Hephaestia sp. MAHUQ-44]MCM8729631.1 dienelactone hydrolase family protein [Hephaestia sp. MAHUQ-44]